MNRIATVIGVASCLILASCGDPADDGSPTAAYGELHRHAARGDWGAVYDRLTDRSRAFTTMLLDPSGFAAENGTGRSRQEFIDLLSRADRDRYEWLIETLAGEVVEERPEEEGVVLVVEVAGKKHALIMVEKEGEWRLEAFFDFWQARALDRGTTPDFEKKLFQCRTRLAQARREFSQHMRQSGGPTTELSLANPLSPDAVAKQVVVIDVPGGDGTTVEPSRAGWVWNSAHETLHAAGYDDKAARREQWERASPEQKQRDLRTLLWIARSKSRDAEPSEQDIRRLGWRAFGKKNPLRNPLSPDAVAARITTTATAGADGESVDPSTAGWLWNTADRTIHVAGYTE